MSNPWLLVVIGAVLGGVAWRYPPTFADWPGLNDWQRRWAARGVRLGLWLMVAACVSALLGDLAAAYAQGEPQPAYTMAHPGKADWLALATQDGRYEIALGTDPGCDGIAADMNVLASTDMSSPTWSLQLPGSDQACTVVEWHWMGDLPCFTNPDGACDVAYS